MSATSKSVVFEKFGGWEELKVITRPLPVPKENEVLVNIKAIGLNRAEEMYLNGRYFDFPSKFPANIGCEGSGIVDAIGENVKNVKVGDRVTGLANYQQSQYTTNHEHAILPADSVVLIPDNIGFAEAATTWFSYLTSYYALIDVGKIKKDDFVLITAASSGVGLSAIQLSKALGAKVIAVTRSPAKRDVLLSYGADYVVSTSTENLQEKVKEYTNGRGANIIYDAVGGPDFSDLATNVAFKGTIILYGLLSPLPTPLPTLALWTKFANFKAYAVAEYTMDPSNLRRAYTYITEGLVSRTFKKSLVGKTFKGIESVPEAHKYLSQADLIGKIVVEF